MNLFRLFFFVLRLLRIPHCFELVFKLGSDLPTNDQPTNDQPTEDINSVNHNRNVKLYTN